MQQPWGGVRTLAALLVSTLSAAHASKSVDVDGVMSPEADGPLDGIFNSRTELGEWAPYFESVYGLDTMVFPFNMSQLNMFYRSRLPSSVVKRLPPVQLVKWSSKPKKLVRGDLYTMFSSEHLFRCEFDACISHEKDSACAENDFAANNCQVRGRSFHFSEHLMREAIDELKQRRVHETGDGATSESPSSLQPARIYHDSELLAPSAGVSSNQFAEVIHSTGDPAGSGFWFYFAKGSGVYLNVSQTMSFRRHVDAWAYFTCKYGDCDHYQPAQNQTNNLLLTEVTVDNAARHGIDTLQFTRFVENGAIKQEIVMTRINTPTASSNDSRVWDRPCPPAEFLASLRGGYGATKPCTCDQTRTKGDVKCI